MEGTNNATSGGILYHDAGYAGLPETDYPTSGLLNEKVHLGAGGQGEIANGRDDTIVERPLSISSVLLFEQIHASLNR